MKVLVFGVFDGLHEGHRYFLKEALRSLGEGGLLVVVVARDAVVKILKNKTPAYGEQERMAMVQEFLPEAIVVLGDEEQGKYDIVKTHRPDIICFGHDQQKLAKDLREKLGYAQPLFYRRIRFAIINLHV